MKHQQQSSDDEADEVQESPISYHIPRFVIGVTMMIAAAGVLLSVDLYFWPNIPRWVYWVVGLPCGTAGLIGCAIALDYAFGRSLD